MKKLVIGIGTMFMLLNVAPEYIKAANNQQNVHLMMNGNAVESDVSPQLIDGHTLVPIRIISDKLEATTNYNDLFKKVTITKDGTLIQFTIGQHNGFVNDQQVGMNQPAEIIQNRTFVPLRFVADSLGVTVGWNQVTQTVVINDKYRIHVNGETLPDAKAFLLGGEVYLSLPDLSTKINLQLTPGSAPTNATVTYHGKSWSIDATANPSDMNWQALSLDNSIFVPVTQLSKHLNATVNVDQISKQITINSYQATITSPVTFNPTTNNSLATNNNPVTNANPSTSTSTSSRTLNAFPNGTFLFIWKANNISNGDIPSMIARAKQLGVTGVIIKFANGSLTGDPNSQSYMDQFNKLVGPFKQAGFKVGGWIYQYLTDVDGEVNACSQAVQAGADFIVLDAEGDVTGKGDQVTQFGQKLRAKYPTLPVGLSSYAFANLHANDVPFDQYNQFVDVMMPQIYWADMGEAVHDAFTASINSYKRFGKPIAPTGQLYNNAQPSDISQFDLLCLESNYRNVSWWDWDEATESQIKSIQNSFAVALN